MSDLIDFFKKEFPDGCSIMTPQFERTEKLEYNWIPENNEEFNKIIDKASMTILFGFGFRIWDTMNNIISENETSKELLKEDENVILFPGEWYNVIPEDFIVTDIFGEENPFKKNVSDDDIRFGCLAYGFRRKINKNDE